MTVECARTLSFSLLPTKRMAADLSHALYSTIAPDASGQHVSLSILALHSSGAARFSSIDELISCLPPLEPVAEFKISIMADPFKEHGFSVLVCVPSCAPVTVFVSAGTEVREQEFFLKVSAILESFREKYPGSAQHPAEQGGQKHICKKPKKTAKKTLITYAGEFNTAVSAASNVPKVFSGLAKLFLLLRQFFSGF